MFGIVLALCIGMGLLMPSWVDEGVYAQIGGGGVGPEKRPIPASRFSELTGTKNRESSAQEIWDKKYNNASYVYGKGPAKFLEENVAFIPAHSKILDVGMGEGRNAVFLAQRGHKVTGIDISAVAVQKAQQLATEFGTRIKSEVISYKNYQVKDGEYDVIICFYFVDKELNKKIMKWLRPGGILIYESYTTNQLKIANFNPSNYGPQDFLGSQELLFMFPSMSVLKYEEPLHKQDFLASIILKKSSSASNANAKDTSKDSNKDSNKKNIYSSK
ncbi:MAG: class I SAM-dependent methyltransferase [Oligoflexia bacterium]|nr:class I SAM-dependent methyltransferase [Oligoflexia bacterium]MBF0366737.1 class I SAM-dependent methyltransferase [Oligoflexia bacterium]